MSLYDTLSADDLMHRCTSHKAVGKKVFSYHAISSTNELAQKLARGGASHGTAVTAEVQTKGKGRGVKTWLSPEGDNLTVTFILRPPGKPEDLTLMPMVVAVAVSEVVQKLTGKITEIKWPNDVLVTGKKISGILIESAIAGNTIEHVLVGIGLNVNQLTFPPDLSARATSMRLLTQRAYARAQVFQDLARTLDTRYAEFAERKIAGLLDACKQRCFMLGKRITFINNGTATTGVAVALTEQGFLQVSTGGTLVTLTQATVTDVKY